jgi:hypothetical protein
MRQLCAEATQLFWRLVSKTITPCGCLAALLGCLSGCAMWNKENWSFDRYRDERAVDIDQRLSSDEPIVKNPF